MKKLETERLELFAGPYDGSRVTVLEGTRRLVLAFDAFTAQPHTDRRRALYIRQGDRLTFAGVAEFGRGLEVRPA